MSNEKPTQGNLRNHLAAQTTQARVADEMSRPREYTGNLSGAGISPYYVCTAPQQFQSSSPYVRACPKCGHPQEPLAEVYQPFREKIAARFEFSEVPPGYLVQHGKDQPPTWRFEWHEKTAGEAPDQPQTASDQTPCREGPPEPDAQSQSQERPYPEADGLDAEGDNK